MKPLLSPFLLLLLCFTACSSGDNDNCYGEPDTAYSSLLGSWYPVATANGPVNKIECFSIDTTGYANDMYKELSFVNNGMQYTGDTSNETHSRYKVSVDGKKLYSFDLNDDTTADTTVLTIALLDEQYLVLIQPADTTPFRRNPYFKPVFAGPVSRLYQRRK